MTIATGIGSWPGTSIREALAQTRELLEDQLPFLPELPGRGPGADMIGRSAGLLVELPVDLQPVGWRLVDRPGRDASRTAALWREDLDELAEAFDGYVGPLKLQVAGPWTLAASIWLHRGERVVVDAGASRYLAESLAEGIRLHTKAVRALIPGADIVVQIDEPSLPAVLAGRLPTASGFGRLPAVDPQVAAATLRMVVAAHDGSTTLHSCSPDLPWSLLRSVGASGLSVDAAQLGPRGWEGAAVAQEEGLRLYLGLLPSSGSAPRAGTVADAATRAWERIGLPRKELGGIVVSSSCGLAAATPPQARDLLRAASEVAQELTERAV